MKHRIAFVGFRHPHIFDLWERVKRHPDCEIVGAWEADPATAMKLKEEGKIQLTFHSLEDLLESDATIVAIGDVYAKRGRMAIASLKAGKHVISDKPICTHLREIDEIERLARSGNYSVGCQLDLMESDALRALRLIIQEGRLGAVCTVSIGAQHPLRYGSRAEWYFEPGSHGGTINDIGIHAFDLVPWLTGARWRGVYSAREWNAKAALAPHFKDCAQFYGRLDNGANCFADLSYLAPDKLGYELPQYWRVTVHGTKGMAEGSAGLDHAIFVGNEDSLPKKVVVSGEPRPGYLQDFLHEIEGVPVEDGMSTARVLTVSRLALEVQKCASEDKETFQWSAQ